jgi:hypothetical protein
MPACSGSFCFQDISFAPPRRASQDVPAKKKRKNKAKQRRRLAKASLPIEDRRSEAVTVAWMLAIIATLGAEIVGGVSLLVTSDWNASAETRSLLPGLMLFIAVVTGVICLLLTPLVHRFRRDPPPAPIQYVAVTASVLPILVAIMMLLR